MGKHYTIEQLKAFQSAGGVVEACDYERDLWLEAADIRGDARRYRPDIHERWIRERIAHAMGLCVEFQNAGWNQPELWAPVLPGGTLNWSQTGLSWRIHPADDDGSIPPNEPLPLDNVREFLRTPLDPDPELEALAQKALDRMEPQRPPLTWADTKPFDAFERPVIEGHPAMREWTMFYAGIDYAKEPRNG